MPKGIYKRTEKSLNGLRARGFKKRNSPWNLGNKADYGSLICEYCGSEYKQQRKQRSKRTFCSVKCKDLSEIGRKKSKEFSEKCRIKARKQFKDGMPETTKRKLRENQIKFIEENYLDNKDLCPQMGKYEKPILDLLEKHLNYKILRQYKIAGYFLDGYCPMLNLAIEIDEKYHNKQIEKDQLRQTNIERELGCTFLRIEAL